MMASHTHSHLDNLVMYDQCHPSFFLVYTDVCSMGPLPPTGTNTTLSGTPTARDVAGFIESSVLVSVSCPG